MDAIVRGTSFLDLNVWSFVAILFMSLIFSFLGLLGGLIGGALFGRKEAAPSGGSPPSFPEAFPPSVAPEAAPEPGEDQQRRGELRTDELPGLPPPGDEDS